MFKVGDKIRRTKPSNKIPVGTIVTVERITGNWLDVKEKEYHCGYLDYDSDNFELVGKENLVNLERYIIKEDACIVFWKDGSKTIVKKMAKAKHNKELAFLTAYFQKHSGLSKTKANKFLSDLEETKQPKKKVK